MIPLPLLFTVFLDFMGFGLVFPIFAPLLLEETDGILPIDTSLGTRGMLIGLLISSYFIAQFFSSPILGALSDRKGRKPILLFTIILTSFGFALGGIGVIYKSIYLLFASRIIAGVASGNYAVAQSVVTDICDENSKTKQFGLINMAYGFGFILGPCIGGRLSDSSFFSWCNYDTPFWMAAILSFINVFWMYFKFKETHCTPILTSLNVFKGLKNLQKAFKMEKLRIIFFAMFSFSFGWGFFCEFIPLFLIQRFNFSASQIGNFYGYMGGLIAISQGLLIRPFVKLFLPRQLLLTGFLCLGATLPALLLFNQPWMIICALPLILFFEALIFPNASSCVSDLADKDNQGELLGIHQSVQSAAIALSPLFSGSLVAFYPHLPISVGSIMTLLAGFIFLLYRKEKKMVSIQ